MKSRNSNVSEIRFYLAKSISIIQDKAREKFNKSDKNHRREKMLENLPEDIDFNYLDQISK